MLCEYLKRWKKMEDAPKNILTLKLIRAYYEIFEMAAVIILAILAVITVSEMASRESFNNSVASKISSLNGDLANISINLSSNEDAKIPTSVFEQRKEASSKIEIFEELKDRVTVLINIGVDSQPGTLKELTNIYQKATTRFADNKSSEGGILKTISNSYYIGFIYEMRSDHLLALAIICCSALGAMIFGLRSGTKMNVRTLTSGLATGFVVYLALKGGQHLFLVTSPDVRIPSNPYSSAFAGLLAGLFSDKAYKMLSSLVDNFASQVENAAGANGEKANKKINKDT
jgi:hypothetical protein